MYTFTQTTCGSLQFHCCGVNSWMDYQYMLGTGIVPQSCCNTTTVNATECAAIHMNVTESVVNEEYMIHHQVRMHVVSWAMEWVANKQSCRKASVACALSQNHPFSSCL